MKRTVRILSLLSLLALAASCRTTVPGPSFIFHIASIPMTGGTAIPLSVIGQLALEFDAHDTHGGAMFDMVPDSTIDGGGAMITTTATGHYQVTFTGDYIRSVGSNGVSGFDVRLPFYSTNRLHDQAAYSPLLTVHVYQTGTLTEIANGAGFIPWPLDDHLNQSPFLVPVVCKTGMDAACSGM